jgi:NADH-quinone oxidoreductase subunit M
MDAITAITAITAPETAMGVGALTVAIALPAAAGLAVLLIPRGAAGLQRGVAFTGALATLGVVASIWAGFDATSPAMQFEEQVPWIRSIGASYHVGIDGLSLLLVALTALLTPITLLGTASSVASRLKAYLSFFLLLEAAMIGVFVALDLLLFYVFWEAMLIPMYFLIGIWGGGRRVYAALKFFLYTMAGSVLMLVAILVLAFVGARATGQLSFDYADLKAVLLPMGLERWLFLAFAVAFAIKVPLLPFHTWLPDAHVEAPTGGSVLLAGVLLKMGTYGFLRFCLPFFPRASEALGPALVILALAGIIYGALMALAQTDLKKLVAYSSVSHLGFVVLGIFAMNPEGVIGGLLQMVNHGINTGALFLLVGMIYDRAHTRLIADFGGVARSMPVFAAATMVFVLGSIGLPGTNGFVGEFLILLGAFRERAVYGILAASGVVLGAIYLLVMVRRMIFGQVTGAALKLTDIGRREILVLVPLVILVFAIGFKPRVFTAPAEPAVEALLDGMAERRAALVRYDERKIGEAPMGVAEGAKRETSGS